MGYFKAGGFKILPTKGDWSKQYGSQSNGVLAVNDDVEQAIFQLQQVVITN